MATILSDLGTRRAGGARVQGDDLWIPLAELEAASGWTLRPEGVCRGDVCVPIPSGRGGDFVSGDGPARSFNLAALARHRGQPVVRSDTGDVWSIGESSADRGRALAALEAPDFELPDLDAKLHRLSAHRGRKVFLVSWASW